MTRVLLAMVFTLSGCVTREAALRREAEGRFTVCWKAARFPPDRQICVQETHAFCLAHGMEITCGIDGWWTQPERFDR